MFIELKNKNDYYLFNVNDIEFIRLQNLTIIIQTTNGGYYNLDYNTRETALKYYNNIKKRISKQKNIKPIIKGSSKGGINLKSSSKPKSELSKYGKKDTKLKLKNREGKKIEVNIEDFDIKIFDIISLALCDIADVDTKMCNNYSDCSDFCIKRNLDNSVSLSELFKIYKKLKEQRQKSQ